MTARYVVRHSLTHGYYVRDTERNAAVWTAAPWTGDRSTRAQHDAAVAECERLKESEES